MCIDKTPNPTPKKTPNLHTPVVLLFHVNFFTTMCVSNKSYIMKSIWTILYEIFHIVFIQSAFPLYFRYICCGKVSSRIVPVKLCFASVSNHKGFCMALLVPKLDCSLDCSWNILYSCSSLNLSILFQWPSAS